MKPDKNTGQTENGQRIFPAGEFSAGGGSVFTSQAGEQLRHTLESTIPGLIQEVVREKCQSMLELQNVLIQTMSELLEYRDDAVGRHIAHIQRYMGILVDALRAGGPYQAEAAAWDRELVLQAAQLHDIGKIAIKDSVLLKPGRLTPEEFEHIKAHTTFGEKIIGRVIARAKNQPFLEYARVMAVTHHEQWDGNGYPKRLKGRQIPLLGRLMAIADVYDALVSQKPYKKAYTHEDAVRIMNEGGNKQFDPVLADTFLNVSDAFEQVPKEG